MSRAGDVIENPVTGETGYVRLGTEETNGALLVSDLRVPASDGPLRPMHFHPGHEERFTVVEGRIAFVRGDTEGVVEVGGHGVVPPGVPHGWWNRRPGRPRPRRGPTGWPLRTADANRVRSRARGEDQQEGIANPLQAAVLAKEFGDVIVFTNPPAWVQRIVNGLLAPLGRLLGYRARFPRHLQIPIESVELEPLPDGIEVPVA